MGAELDFMVRPLYLALLESLLPELNLCRGAISFQHSPWSLMLKLKSLFQTLDWPGWDGKRLHRPTLASILPAPSKVPQKPHPRNPRPSWCPAQKRVKAILQGAQAPFSPQQTLESICQPSWNSQSSYERWQHHFCPYVYRYPPPGP